MKKVFLTGKDVKEFANAVKKHKRQGCYLCGRSEKDKSIFLADNVGISPIKLGRLKTKAENIEFNFLICHECFILIDAIRDLLIENEVSREVNLSANLN